MQLPCQGHHMAFWVTLIPLGWNTPAETAKADTLLFYPQPPWRSLCSMGLDPRQVIGISFLKSLSRLLFSLSSLTCVEHILHLWSRVFRYAALKGIYLWRLVTYPWQCWKLFFPSQITVQRQGISTHTVLGTEYQKGLKIRLLKWDGNRSSHYPVELFQSSNYWEQKNIWIAMSSRWP